MSQVAIGLIETRGIVALVEAADVGLKAADVTLKGWRQLGGGLVSLVFEGDVAAIRAAVDAGAAAAAKIGEVVSTDVIPRPHGELEKVLPKP